MKHIICFLFIISLVQSITYSKKYKSTSESDIWKNEMENRITELSIRLEEQLTEQQEELQKYSQYLITIIRILNQKLERENTIFEDLICDDKKTQYLQEEINVLKYKYIE